MSADRAGGVSGDGKDSEKDRSVAKTAGFVVFSGIAMSILKALNPLNKPNNLHTINEAKPIDESTQSVHQHEPLSLEEPIIIKKPIASVEQNVTESHIKKPVTSVEKNVPESLPRKIEIEKGDTLWGLSRKYGVSIDAIKEANGLTGDIIYAGKKLNIP